MAEKGKQGERVSLDKKSSGSATSRDPKAVPAASRPKQIAWVVAALVVSGLAALGASLSLYGLHGFLLHQATVANNKLKVTDKNHKTAAEIAHTVSIQPGISVIQSALYLVVLLFIARAVWRGRYWSRWAVLGVLVLATFTGIYGGLLQITAIAADAPLALKVPIFLASLSLLVAAATVGGVKSVSTWLNLTRPDRPAPAGAPTRRGLFGTARVDEPGASSVGASVDARSRAGDEHARAKQRVTTEPRQSSGEVARARASKSRRTPS